jgi:hypothetical protein
MGDATAAKPINPETGIDCYKLPVKLDKRYSLPTRNRYAACFSMRPIRALRRSTIAAAALASLALTGCSGTQEAARQAGDQVGQAAKDAAATTGEAAKTAATATGEAALGQAVTPVLDLLKKSEGDVKAGKLAEAIAAMGGFQGLWNTAAPIIKPMAGDKWPIINTAANLVLSTFAKGSTPTQANASSALTGLIGPLSALLTK